MEKKHLDVISKFYELHSGVHFLIDKSLIQDLSFDAIDELVSMDLVELHPIEGRYRLTKEGKKLGTDIVTGKHNTEKELDRETLKAEAEELGIKVHHNAKAETIKEQIEEHKASN